MFTEAEVDLTTRSGARFVASAECLTSAGSFPIATTLADFCRTFDLLHGRGA